MRFILMASAMLTLAGCGNDNHVPADDSPTVSPSEATAPADPADQQISPNLDFRFSTKSEIGLSNDSIVSQAAILSSRDENIYHIRYMVINNRNDCVLYPVIENSEDGVSRFDIIDNIKDDEKIYEGTVLFRPGDQVRLGRPLNLSNPYGFREFVPYETCGRPSNISVFFDEGHANFQIFISGD